MLRPASALTYLGGRAADDRGLPGRGPGPGGGAGHLPGHRPPGAEVEAASEAGALHRVWGDLRQARSCHQRALDLARWIGSSWDEVHALPGLGLCALTAEAEDQLRQALEIFQRIGAAEART